MPVVEEHDFGLVNVYDAGPSFRQDDHQCDFCGTHLRYTAEIAAENDRDIQYKVGLDCLEHAMGTGWSHMQDVERRIKELKEEAKKQRRKEKYAEEWEDEIEWLERYLEIRDNDFLSDMYEVLTTGESKFSKKMRDAVHDNMNNVDLDELEEQEEWIQGVIERLNELIELIAEVDGLEWDDRREEYVGQSSSYDFVKSVRDFAVENRRVTDNQLEPMNDIYDRYKKRLEEQDEQEEEEDEAPAVPF